MTADIRARCHPKKWVGRERMFGYVKADKPEMKIREYEYYRGVYCGLCLSLGKCGGQCARMTLSYDFAFMALVRMAILGVTPKFRSRRCIAHPFKKRSMAEPNDSLTYCAAASLLLSYRKIKDDICDEKGGKRLKALAARPALSIMKRGSSKKYRDLENEIAARLAELSDYEKSEAEPSLDAPAEIFGELLAIIMSYGLEGGGKRIAEKIGRHLGKWIYIVDACDDYFEDVKRGRYNPVANAYGKNGLEEGEKAGLKNSLTYELMEAEKGFDLIDYPGRDAREVISNIIYLGMPSVAAKVIDSMGKEDKNDRSV